MGDKKVYAFSGKVVKCVCNKPDFKIYGLEVDAKKFPELEINKFGNVCISGDIPELIENVTYDIEAEESPSSKYGMGYKVIHIKRDIPKTGEDVYAFLSEILTKEQADVLYENYPNILTLVKEGRTSEVKLNKLKGIKEKRFAVICKKITENFYLSELVTEFKGLISLSVIRKLYGKYTSIEKIRENLNKAPYDCLCNLGGIGFKTADTILMEIEKISIENVVEGKPPILSFDEPLRESRDRCLACVKFILEQNEEEGHTNMSLVELRKKVLEMCPHAIDKFLSVMKDESIWYDKSMLLVSLKSSFYNEFYIALAIKMAIQQNITPWEYDIEKFRNVNGNMLSDEQMKSLEFVCHYPISILNGSAGCGKSMSVKGLLNMLESDNKYSYILMTPTGKSSKVLADFTKRQSSTIHRGLGYNPSGYEFDIIDKYGNQKIITLPWEFNQYNKLETDLLIIDEFSMVDVDLFKHLIDALDLTKTRLLIIGDNAQLCSVGAGNLLHDFMQSKIIPTATLTKVFRYSEGGLMKVATDVRMGKKYLSSSMRGKVTFFGKNKDYAFLDMPQEKITNNVLSLYQKMMKKYNIEDIQVLTSKNVGEYGTVKLNNEIQRVANPNYGSNVKITYGDTTYFVGDLVIQKSNNYRAKISRNRMEDYEDWSSTAFVANGETGKIIEIDIQESLMYIDFDGIIVEYSKDDLKGLGLGYSISIHRSQGSSIKAVILITPSSDVYMLNSNLIYVGLTRMKEVCYHFGSISAVNQSVLKKANFTRRTFMQYLLNGNIQMNNDLDGINNKVTVIEKRDKSKLVKPVYDKSDIDPDDIPPWENPFNYDDELPFH